MTLVKIKKKSFSPCNGSIVPYIPMAASERVLTHVYIYTYREGKNERERERKKDASGEREKKKRDSRPMEAKGRDTRPRSAEREKEYRGGRAGGRLARETMTTTTTTTMVCGVYIYEGEN